MGEEKGRKSESKGEQPKKKRQFKQEQYDRHGLTQTGKDINMSVDAGEGTWRAWPGLPGGRWIPAFAGMTIVGGNGGRWIPAVAGMTGVGGVAEDRFLPSQE